MTIATYRRRTGDLGTSYQVYGQASRYDEARRQYRRVKVYVDTAESRRSAIAALEDHNARQRAIAAGELPAGIDDRRSLNDGLDAWLAAIGAEGSRSYFTYASRMQLYVRPELGAHKLGSVTTAQIMTTRAQLLGTISNATINCAMETLGTAFTWFSLKEWVGKNPLVTLPPLEVIRPHFFWLENSAQVERLLGACTQNIRALVAVLVCTGLRIDEALHLEWSDVDLERRVITVHRGSQGTVKSGKMRGVPIGDSALTIFRELRLTATTTLVWPGQTIIDGVPQPRQQSSVLRPFKTALRRAGLPTELRIHDLRHSFASLFLAAGGSLFHLQRILGHSSPATTAKFYAHLQPTAYRQDDRRIEISMPM